MSRSAVYQQYKALCLKKHVKMARTWNTPGCTIAWLSKQVKRRKRSPPEPEAPTPEPEETTQARYEREMSDIEARAHAREAERARKAAEEARKAAKEASKRKPYQEDDVNLSLDERIMRAIGRLGHAGVHYAAYALIQKLLQQEREEAGRKEERQEEKTHTPPGMNLCRSKNLELLGLTQDDEQLIKKAFRRLALINHPDKNNGCDIQFKRILAAYEALK